MRTVRAALVAAFVLGIASVAAVVTSQHSVRAVARGEDLTSVERLALFAANSYVRSAPLIGLAVIGGAALVTGLRGNPASTADVRRERQAWIVVAVAAYASEAALLLALNR